MTFHSSVMFGAAVPTANPDTPQVIAGLTQATDLADFVGDKRCAICRKDVRPAFSRRFHHKINKGAVKCSDCHDPLEGLRPAFNHWIQERA